MSFPVTDDVSFNAKARRCKAAKQIVGTVPFCFFLFAPLRLCAFALIE